MIKFISYIIRKLALLSSFIYSIRIHNLLNCVFNIFYSEWVKKGFKTVGANFYAIRPLYLRGGKYIEIGDNCHFSKGLRIETFNKHKDSKYKPCITIGNNFSVNYDCHIGCIKKITIGNNVLFASRVFITDHFHGSVNSRAELLIPPLLRNLTTKGEVNIGDNVWVGEGVAIMPGVTIGEGAVIGANSVVTKNIPSYAVVAGIPARIIKQF